MVWRLVIIKIHPSQSVNSEWFIKALQTIGDMPALAQDAQDKRQIHFVKAFNGIHASNSHPIFLLTHFVCPNI